MAKKKQDDQLEHTYSSYVRIRDVALKTCQKRSIIGRSGEKGSEISVLAALHDDDDIYIYVYIYIYIYIYIYCHPQTGCFVVSQLETRSVSSWDQKTNDFVSVEYLNLNSSHFQRKQVHFYIYSHIRYRQPDCSFHGKSFAFMHTWVPANLQSIAQPAGRSIYIYIYICVCVCVYPNSAGLSGIRDKHRFTLHLIFWSI